MRICRPAEKSSSIIKALILIVSLLGTSAGATSITIEIADGSVWAIYTRTIPVGGESLEVVPFSGFGYVLRQVDARAHWDWNAMTGLLVINVARQRFSLSAKDGVVAVNNRLRKVTHPIRSMEQDIWIPMESFYLLVQSIKGMRIRERPVIPPLPPEITPGPTPRGDEMIDESLLPGDETIDAPGWVPPLAGPGIGERAAWRIVLAPLWNEAALEGANVSGLRPALTQIADRVSGLLGDSPDLEPVVLSEQGQVTTGVRVIDQVARQRAEMAVFLKVESSPLVTAPGYMVYYVDESIDSSALRGPTDPGSSRAARYMPFQVGNRRLAELLSAQLAKVEGFAYRPPLPAPMYMLKRCPARSALVVLTFPARSPELRRVSDRTFRENVARQIAEALRDYQRERLETGGERVAGGGSGS